jgi:hypothetical protein
MKRIPWLEAAGWHCLDAQLALKEQGKLEALYAPLPLTFDEVIEEFL